MDTLQCLKLAATGMAGISSGCAFFINAADHPARMKLDLENNRTAWKEIFNRAKKFQSAMVTLGSTAGVAVYYMESENQHRALWLIGAGVLFSIWPWTLLVMVPDIKENLKDDVFETKGRTWVQNHLVRWNKQHGYRTVAGMAAFGIFLYALSKK